jgi:hypothetical protein
MARRTVRSKKHGGRRHRTRGAKTGGSPRPSVSRSTAVLLLVEIEANLGKIDKLAEKTHGINDIIGEQDYGEHALRYNEATREAISNAYNKVEDAVNEIRAACEDGLRASRSAVASLR